MLGLAGGQQSWMDMGRLPEGDEPGYDNRTGDSPRPLAWGDMEDNQGL